MRTVGKLTILGAVAAAGALFLSSPATADPNGPPCEGPLGFVCSMVPMMPELEHDLDLTQQNPEHPPATIDVENQPPADVCALGCV